MSGNTFLIQILADRFDSAWQSGQRPCLIEYLNSAADTDRLNLLELLLPIEIEYRQNNKESVVAADYSGLGSEEYKLVRRELLKLAGHEQSEAEAYGATSGQELNSLEASHNPDLALDPGSSGPRDDVTKPPGQHNSKQNSRMIGPYKLLQQIGEGGMGTVWMAEQEKPVRRRVALKLIKGAMADKQVIARFEAERQAVAMMDHPNIAKILDAGTTETGNPFFVMELVNGVPINQYCDQHKLTPDERLKLFVPVCKAVQHAHQKGIIHRDLKPSNVLVQMQDGAAVAKVIDFGLAKALDQTHKLTDKTMFTRFGQVVGTLQYMSPEQATMDAMSVDTRTDIYSLGVMLYELLAGSTPVEKETLQNAALLHVLKMIREREPPKPSHRLSSSGETLATISELRQIQPAKLQQILRGELDWIVMKALEKERTRRYETANDFAQDIDNYLSGDTVNACPPSARYRLQKLVRRNKGLVASVLAVGFVLLAGIAGTTYGLIQANQKAAEAVKQKNLADEKTDEAKASETKALETQRKAEEEKLRADAEAKRARDSDALGKLQLAQARWEGNRVREARDLLELIPNEKEYRNFEWHFWRRKCLGSHVTSNAKSVLIDVDFYPDGSRVVSADFRNKTLTIWDAINGEKIHVLRGHTRAVGGVAVSPDGTLIASASFDNTVKIWDAVTGKELRTLNGHAAAVIRVAFSPDGLHVASASADKTLKVWEVDSGKELVTLRGHAGAVISVAYSPDGRRLASTSGELVKVWDVASGTELRTLSKLDGLVATNVSFSPDGRRIAAVSHGHDLKMWNAANGDDFLHVRGCGTHDLAFSPDGDRIATAFDRHVVKILDADSGRELQVLRGHTDTVHGVAFSPDGRRLTSISEDNTLKIWDLVGGKETQTLRGHTDWVRSVAFSPDGNRIASASKDKTIKIWSDDVGGGQPQVLRGHTGEVHSVAFSPDGKWLASGSMDRMVMIWDSTSGNERLTFEGHTGEVRSVAISPNGCWVASASDDKTVRIWNVATGEKQVVLSGHTEPVTGVVFSPDGRLIASASADKTLKIWNWDEQNGSKKASFKGHSDAVTSVAFSPDGRLLASGSDDKIVKIWDVVSGSELRTLRGHAESVTAISFSPDGRRIASASARNGDNVRIWDVASGSETLMLPGHMNWVFCVAFSPDGRRLATGSWDRTVKIWDGTTARRTLHGHSNQVTHLAFSEDSSRLYSQSSDKKIVWDSVKGAEIKNADWDEAPDVQIQDSPDGRWQATSEGKNIQLVDLEFENTPKERSYRSAKAKFQPWWHWEQAKKDEKSQKWFSAIFHFALLLKDDPEHSRYFDLLHSSHKKLAAKFKTELRDLESHLPKIVEEALELPRGTKPPEIPDARARRINATSWSRVVTQESFDKSPFTNKDLFRCRGLCRQHPNGIYYNTLGVAEFRMGNFERAIEAALRSVELTPKELRLDGPHPVDFAVLAMSHFKLDRIDKAEDYQEEFDAAMTDKPFKDDPECQSFALEVKELFEKQKTLEKQKDSR
jgi:WD40 repeat protein/serine/threonine protein kinase